MVQTKASTSASTPKKISAICDVPTLEATKRAIEEQFIISDAHYSDHTRRIRDQKHPKAKVQNTSTNQSVPSELPTAAVNCFMHESQEVEVVEVNLGTEFVQQLEQMFGNNVFTTDRDGLVLGDMKLKTAVFMQKSLANQIYSVWVESLYNQLENQKQAAVREDLELARQLDAREKYPGLFQEQPPKDLKDIIDLEISLAAYKNDIEKWKNEVPNTMATRLAREKLRALFPNFDSNLLDELLVAHKNDIDETIRVLKSSTLIDADTDVVIEQRSKELFSHAKNEIDQLSETYFKRETDAQQNGKNEYDFLLKNNDFLSPEETKSQALREFQDCRNVAQHHGQLKSDCYAKARNALQRKENAVALYYSQIAELHKTKIDFFNHKAANCLMEAHNLSQNSKNMLDLHYLHSAEATECLDMFLDRHINKIKTIGQTYKHVFVITGRGKNSINGIPAIKIRVKQRLRERNLKFNEVNPGLLNVKLTSAADFSSELRAT